MAYLLVVGGLVLLVFGGDALVRGAVNLSLKLGISALVVSLTIVAFGTSAPELLIVIQSAFEGVPQLAMGNIIGSNIANVLLVLGLPALIFGIASQGTDTRRDYFLMIAASLLFIALVFTMPFGPLVGAILFLAMIGIIGSTVYYATKSGDTSSVIAEEVEEAHDPLWKAVMFLILGLIALPLGAKFLVDGSIEIATRYGISEAVIGLTIVAIGTSLPELATSVAAAYRRQADVAIGNVLGSNLFNLLAIGAVAAFFGPVPVDPQFLKLDLWVMLAASALLLPYVIWHANLNRVWGVAFCLAYAGYMWVIL